MPNAEDSFLDLLARRHYLPEGRSTILPRWILALYVATELLSVVVIAWTCVELVYDVDWAKPESIGLDAVASLVFVLDWAVGLSYHAQTTLPADSSWKDRHRAKLYAAGSYLVHPGRIVDLLSGLLPLPLMLYSGVAGLGVIRFVRVLRTAARLLGLAHEFGGANAEPERSHPMLRTTGLVAAAGALMLVVSQAVYRIEHVLPDTTFKSRGDALWWGIVTLTTIGYGDIYPKTTEGRVLAALLMFFGIGVIAALTGVVAEYYIRKPVGPPSVHPSARKLEEDVSALRTYLEHIDQDVRHLRAENERLHAAIEQSVKSERQ